MTSSPSSPPPSYSEVIINPAYAGSVELVNPPAYHWSADHPSSISPVVDGSTQTRTSTSNATTNTTSEDESSESADCHTQIRQKIQALRSICQRIGGRHRCRSRFRSICRSRCTSCNVDCSIQTKYYFTISAVYLCLTALTAIAHGLYVYTADLLNLFYFMGPLLVAGVIFWIGLNVTRRNFKRHKTRLLIALIGAAFICVGAAMCIPYKQTYLIPAAVSSTSLLFALTNLYPGCHSDHIKKLHLFYIILLNGILGAILYGIYITRLDDVLDVLESFSNLYKTTTLPTDMHNTSNSFNDSDTTTTRFITSDELHGKMFESLMFFILGGIFINVVNYIMFRKISTITRQMHILITESFLFLCLIPFCCPAPTY